MDLIVDATILFSALIKDSKTSDLMVQNSLHLYAPEFIFAEFEDHREILIKKTHRDDEDYMRFLNILRRKIELVPAEEIRPFVPKAIEICPDINDVPYFALSLKMQIPIWTGDKKLKKQNVIKIYQTHELLEIIDLD